MPCSCARLAVWESWSASWLGWQFVIKVDLLFISSALALSGRGVICAVACQGKGLPAPVISKPWHRQPDISHVPGGGAAAVARGSPFPASRGCSSASDRGRPAEKERRDGGNSLGVIQRAASCCSLLLFRGCPSRLKHVGRDMFGEKKKKDFCSFFVLFFFCKGSLLLGVCAPLFEIGRLTPHLRCHVFQRVKMGG